MAADLDIEREADLVAYLRDRGSIGPGEEPVVTVLGGGVSCRTVRVDRANAPSWVLKQALPQLRVEDDWFSDPRRIHREAMAMEMLADLVPPGSLPRLIFEDRAQDLVAMEAVARPHEVWKSMLLAGDVRDEHVRRFGRLLADIHRESTARPGAFSGAFADRSFFESLRIDPYYTASGRRRPAARDFLGELIADTRRHRITATHGDYSPKNVLVKDSQLVLLDHEVMHWGDGAFDLGFAMTHLLAKSRHVPAARRTFLDAAELFWETYRRSAGPPFGEAEYEQRVVRHTIGCVLARAVGKSALEYLDDAERAAQAAAAVSLTADVPHTVAGLVERFDAAPAWEDTR